MPREPILECKACNKLFCDPCSEADRASSRMEGKVISGMEGKFICSACGKVRGKEKLNRKAKEMILSHVKIRHCCREPVETPISKPGKPAESSILGKRPLQSSGAESKQGHNKR